LEEKSEEDSKSIKEKVINARKIQQKRFEWTNLTWNSHITAQNIKKYIKLWKDEEAFLQSIWNNYWYSARLIHRLMKLSRTIADLDGEEHIKRNHIAEAFQYRSTNMLSQ
jgi:magnesium chelatase family protein